MIIPRIVPEEYISFSKCVIVKALKSYSFQMAGLAGQFCQMESAFRLEGKVCVIFHKDVASAMRQSSI